MFFRFFGHADPGGAAHGKRTDKIPETAPDAGGKAALVHPVGKERADAAAIRQLTPRFLSLSFRRKIPHNSGKAVDKR